MSRPLTAEMQAEITAKIKSPIVLFEALFDSGPLRFCTGIGPITWQGNVFTGSGDLLTISRLTETQKLKAAGIEFTLKGYNNALISLALNEPFQGRPVSYWLGMLDANRNIVNTPIRAFRGKMDVMPIKRGAKTAMVKLTAENSLRALERANSSCYTDEDQQARFPGDKFFEFVPDLQDREIVLEQK